VEILLSVWPRDHDDITGTEQAIEFSWEFHRHSLAWHTRIQMSELDALVQRTVDTVTMIAKKAARFSTKLLLGVVVVCVAGFLLGVAALSGLSSGIQQVWIVLGLVFGSIAIGSAFVARWRLGGIKRHVPELANEVRSLLSDGKDATRTVIETFAVDADGDGEADVFDDSGSPIVLSRQMYGFKRMSGSGLESSERLTAAVKAITSFPVLVLVAILISMVFGFLGFIFLIALAL
jgi:hypothetical protein